MERTERELDVPPYWLVAALEDQWLLEAENEPEEGSLGFI